MKTVKVNWDVSETSGEEKIPLVNLGCETMEDWKALDREEQEERLQNALDELPERVCIIVDSWS